MEGCLRDDSEREAWRQARQQISDYENHLLERHLDVKQEQTALEVEIGCLRDVQTELVNVNKRIHGLEMQINEQRVLLLSLHKTKSAAEGNIAHFLEQQELLKKDIAGLTEKADAERVSFASHIEDEERHARMFSEHLQAHGDMVLA